MHDPWLAWHSLKHENVFRRYKHSKTRGELRIN